ncbi:hypothetical protein [Methylotuvimicrobium buryatense]|uniref:hypothetical protein n=1 Tax=Methylotuvimicrobium buryatense TaxID=95641 RepID=UPI001AD8E293|nr:hypothetical protein [Methylotuvimicrobium buryatense]
MGAKIVIAQINVFLRDWLRKEEYPMALLKCLGSVVGFSAGSLGNIRAEVVGAVCICSASQDLFRMNKALQLLPEGDYSSGLVLSKLTSTGMLQSFDMTERSSFLQRLEGLYE